MEFKDMLKYFRKREGLTQGELAQKLGVSTSRISMYETGEREPDFETEEKIADFFNTDLNTLRGRDNEQPNTTGMLPEKIARKYSKLSSQSKDIVHTTIETEYKKEQERIDRFKRALELEKVTTIEEARDILGDVAAYGGYASEKTLINMANKVLQENKKKR